MTASPVHHRVYIGLGANLGDRAATLAAAIDALRQSPGVAVLRVSTFHETAPVGGPPDQPAYLNAVAELAVTLTPHALLARLHEIEARFGRRRDIHHGPRTLDLDLLLFADRQLHGDALRVPHPRMWDRPFVLEPLRELVGPHQIATWRAQFAPNPAPEPDHVR